MPRAPDRRRTARALSAGLKNDLTAHELDPYSTTCILRRRRSGGDNGWCKSRLRCAELATPKARSRAQGRRPGGTRRHGRQGQPRLHPRRQHPLGEPGQARSVERVQREHPPQCRGADQAAAGLRCAGHAGNVNGPQAQRPEAVSGHLQTGGRCGRGERSQADVIDYLRRFVVGAEGYLDSWLTRERSG